MSSEPTRFPRLRTGDALAVADRFLDDPSSVSPRTQHPDQIYAPFGGDRVVESQLQSARDAVIEAVTEARATHDRAQKKEFISWQTRFDVHVGLALHGSLSLTRSEAAVDGVWNWITLVLLPDVVRHRLSTPSAVRLTGGLRNLFSVTWWPVEILGDLIEPSSGRSLQVDEVVGLFERPTLSRDNPLALEYARAVRTLPARDRATTTRELAKSVRRVGAHTCWGLSDLGRLQGLLGNAAIRASESSETADAEPSVGPILGNVRLGVVALDIEIERSDARLQPTGSMNWTAIDCPGAAEEPDALVIEGQRVDLTRRGETRAGHPRYKADQRLSNGVRVAATVIRRGEDVFMECILS